LKLGTTVLLGRTLKHVDVGLKGQENNGEEIGIPLPPDSEVFSVFTAQGHSVLV